MCRELGSPSGLGAEKPSPHLLPPTGCSRAGIRQALGSSSCSGRFLVRIDPISRGQVKGKGFERRQQLPALVLLTLDPSSKKRGKIPLLRHESSLGENIIVIIDPVDLDWLFSLSEFCGGTFSPSWLRAWRKEAATFICILPGTLTFNVALLLSFSFLICTP